MSISAESAKPFVSVVVPSYNARKTIEECLSTLSNQTYPRERYEILLADNGSKDGTCEFVTAQFPDVKLLHVSQKGSGYARNAGIEAAHGEFIASTDSDCAVAEDWIAVLVDTLLAAPENVAAIGGEILPYSIKTAVEQFRPVWVSQPNLAARQAGFRYAATPNAIFRASALKSVGCFNGLLGFDDTDLGLRLTKAGYQIEYTNLAKVRHRNPASLDELYKHRRKYGKHNILLLKNHPQLLGDPTAPGAEIKLLIATVRRIAADILVKQPLAIFGNGKDRPKIWPVIDAAVALGNYQGFRDAAFAIRKNNAAQKTSA